MKLACAFHGGRSFQAIGDDFQTLERRSCIVTADVLDAWFDPSPRVLSKLREFLPFLLRSSPPVHGAGVVDAIARARGVPRESILIGGGSSDLIFTCLPRLVAPEERALIIDPMYGEYDHVFTQTIGAGLHRFRLEESENFRVDAEQLGGCVRELRPRIVVVVNPNSPTGRLLPRPELTRLLDAVPEQTLILIDETYVEYAGSDESMEREAARRDNVMVLKSMSKVYALSGLRIGYLVSAPQVIRSLARWIPPWAVSLPAQVAAIEALADPEYYARRYCETHALRDQLVRLLCSCRGVRVYPGCANFVLLRVPGSAQQTLEQMETRGVYVRNCDSMSRHFNDRFLRVTVRTQQENSVIQEALAEALMAQQQH